MDSTEKRQRAELLCKALGLIPHAPCGTKETADAIGDAIWGDLPKPEVKSADGKGGAK